MYYSLEPQDGQAGGLSWASKSVGEPEASPRTSAEAKYLMVEFIGSGGNRN